MIDESELRNLNMTQFATDRARDTVVWVDEDGGIAYANDACCSSLGYTRHELLSMKVFDIDPLFPADGFEQHKADMRRLGSMVFESQHLRKDGTRFPVEVSTNFFEYNGRFLACAYARDISDRKRAEHALHQVVEEQSILLDTIDQLVWYHKDAGTFGAVNRAYADFLGRPVEALAHRHVREVFADGVEARQCIETAEYVITNRRQLVNELWYRNANDERRLLSITSTPKLNEVGKVEYVVCCAHDVTESKRIQEMMIHSEKIVSLGGLAAGIAHELNNPLGTILQSMQNLRRRTRTDFHKNVEVAESVGLDMKKVREYVRVRQLDVFLDDLQRAADRAAYIVRHMLDFSRPATSGHDLHDVRKIINDALTLAQSIRDASIGLDFRTIRVQVLIPDVSPRIYCNAMEIEQVLLNLLRNAAQALSAQGASADVPSIEIQVTKVQDKLRIAVSDNGPGIPSGLRTRIFEPFFTSKPPGLGTGLGLAVSYFIITNHHGGSLYLDFERNEGARFVIELPTIENPDRKLEK